MITLIQADARRIPLPDGSIHCVVTSPPYWGLRDYRVNGQIGLEQSPDAYVATMVEVFREVGRVLRDDGTVWLNLGSSYASASQGRSSSKVREQLGEIGSEFSVKFMPNADLPFALRDESVFISGGHRKV